MGRDILAHGLNPAELMIVLSAKDDLNRYYVLEGNRRVAALKALENPEVLAGAVDDGVLRDMRALSKEYQRQPIESVSCLVVKSREEADHWIELRHTGQNEGAGIVPWASDDISRFRARRGSVEVHSQALNLLEKGGYLTPEARRSVPTASLKRLIGTPEVRSKIGIEIEQGELKLLADERRVARALLYIAQDLASGRTKTHDIYTRAKRIKYAQSLPANIVVPTQTGKGAKATSGGGRRRGTAQQSTRARRARAREYLIPGDCVLVTSDRRIREIEGELRTLSLADFQNAVAVLFRVFVELSVDSYITTNALPTSQDSKLRAKLLAVLNDLLKHQKLTRHQASPVRRALQKDSFLAPSVNVMNDYVHNPHVFPAPVDLRAYWSSLQPFIMAIWAP